MPARTGRAPRLARALLAALVAGALTGGPTAVAAPPAGTGSATVAFLQFNMCGQACGTGMAVVADVESWITGHTPQPFVVTLDEVCRSQYAALYADLLPYYGHFEPTILHRCRDGSDYGIAILLRTSTFTYLGSWPLPNPGAGEPRTMSCLRTSVPGASQSLVACVTHLDTAYSNIPSQVAAVASRARGYWAGNKVLVGGDFNAPPDSPALDPMYSPLYPGGTGVFDEVGASTSARATAAGSTGNEPTGGCQRWPCGDPAGDQPTRKIDYIFLSRYDFVSSGTEVTGAPHSDHVPLWATAVVT